MTAAAVLVLALMMTGFGAFTDDPFHQGNVEDVVVSADGRTLSMFVGTCDRYELDVEETDQEVRITARAEDVPGAGCRGVPDVEVQLEAPLGDRTVIDASFDEERLTVHRCGTHAGRRERCRELSES